MSDPVLTSNTYGNTYLYYTCDRDPTANEPMVYSSYPGLLILWWNTTTNNFFVCTDNTTSSMVWVQQVNVNNISTLLSSMGVNVPVPRSRTQRTSPAFNTSYRPSTTSDTEVNLTLNVTALLSFSSTVNIQVSTDNSTWVTISSSVRNLSLAVNLSDLYTFTVPIGSYYRIVQATGTASSIVSIYELSV